MVTTFSASAGRIYVKDSNGDFVFDSDFRNFIPTDFIDSDVLDPIVTSEHVATCINGAYTDVDVDDDTVIATINAAADTVFGAFKVTVSGFTPMGAGGWFVGNGSYLHGQFTRGLSNEDHATQFDYVSGAVVYTFRAEGGELIFNERAFIRATHRTSGTNSSTMPATTVDFKLWCGSFI